MRLVAISRLSRALISLMPGSMILSEKSATFRDHALLLRPALEQTVRDQACGAPAPRVVGAHAQAAVLAGHDGASPGIADLEAHRVFGAADPSHHADEGLLGAEIEGNPGVAAIAVVQRTRLCGGGIRAPDLDQLVAPRLREQLADLFGDLRELRRIGLAGGRHGSARVLELEIEQRELDRCCLGGARNECRKQHGTADGRRHALAPRAHPARRSVTSRRLLVHRPPRSTAGPASPAHERHIGAATSYCRLSATNRSSPSALETSSNAALRPSFLS